MTNPTRADLLGKQVKLIRLRQVSGINHAIECELPPVGTICTVVHVSDRHWGLAMNNTILYAPEYGKFDCKDGDYADYDPEQ